MRACYEHALEDSKVPIYEYACRACEHEFETLQKISEPPLADCPRCGAAELRKKVSAARFRLKGGGWYETDFKSGDKKNLVGDPSASGESKSGAGKDAAGASDSNGSKATAAGGGDAATSNGKQAKASDSPSSSPA